MFGNGNQVITEGCSVFTFSLIQYPDLFTQIVSKKSRDTHAESELTKEATYNLRHQQSIGPTQRAGMLRGG